MTDVFDKIADGFNISWDPELLMSGCEVVTEEFGIVRKQNNELHWQYYPNSQVYFSRNFHHIYVSELNEVADKLIKLQDNLKNVSNKSWMLDDFIHHDVSIKNMGLIKVASGINVNLHRDLARYYGLNIGIKNSNTCTTHIYSGPVVEKTLINENNIKHSYTMNDGDVFLVATRNPHSVESNINLNEKRDRYIITYTVSAASLYK